MTGVMLSGAASLLLMAAPLGSQLSQSFASGLALDRGTLFDSHSMVNALASSISEALLVLAPFVGILLFAVFASASAIGGWSFSTQALAFKFERLNPVKGIKRIFSANSLNELIKAMAKFGLVGVIAVGWLWWSVDELLTLGRQPIKSAITGALQICGVSFLVVSCGLTLIAAADVPFQLWNFKKKMRMTRQEVRDEFKETDGRPEVKARLRALQQQIATGRMMEDVPDADVIITNPTHYAVALKYDDSSMSAPRVLAKGRDLVARRIREVAAEHGVALFSAPPLARALFRTADIGQEIPAGLYNAVAQVLAYIYQLRETLKPGMRYPEPPVIDFDDSTFGVNANNRKK